MADAGWEWRMNPIPSLLCLTQWAPTPAGSQRQLSKSGFEWQLSFQESNQRNLLEIVTHESITTTSPSPSSCRAFTRHPVTIPLSCRALTRHPWTRCSTTLLPEYIWIPAGVYPAQRRDGNEKDRTGMSDKPDTLASLSHTMGAHFGGLPTATF